MVAVRVRPFNKREVALNSKLIVTMNGQKTTLQDPSGKETARDFSFDYSYWSFNPVDAHFADNPKVYRDLGVFVLENAIAGYNCCLFAYGQTGKISFHFQLFGSSFPFRIFEYSPSFCFKFT